MLGLSAVGGQPAVIGNAVLLGLLGLAIRRRKRRALKLLQVPPPAPAPAASAPPSALELLALIPPAPVAEIAFARVLAERRAEQAAPDPAPHMAPLAIIPPPDSPAAAVAAEARLSDLRERLEPGVFSTLVEGSIWEMRDQFAALCAAVGRGDAAAARAALLALAAVSAQYGLGSFEAMLRQMRDLPGSRELERIRGGLDQAEMELQQLAA